MRFAVIEDGRVANVVLADEDFATEQGWIEATDGVAIGWLYDGEFSAPDPADALVPEFVTQGQAKIALWRKEPDGALYTEAETLVNMVGGEALVWWNSAETFRRDNEHVAAIGVALSLSNETIDTLFRTAALIE